MALTYGPNCALLVNANQGEQHYTAWQQLLRAVDFHLQPWVINMTTATPPGTPADGDCYVVAASPTGAWVGHTNAVARYSTIAAAWEFFAPINGWSIFDRGTNRQYFFNGTAWSAITSLSDVNPTASTLVQRTATGGANFKDTVAIAAQAAGAGDLLTGTDSAGNLVWRLTKDGQLIGQYATGFSPNGGLNAGITLQPIASSAAEAPDVAWRTSPLASSAGDYSSRIGLQKAAAGTSFTARNLALGSLMYRAVHRGDDGQLEALRLGLASYDGTWTRTQILDLFSTGTTEVNAKSYVADGASAVAIAIDCATKLVTAGAKLLSLRNNSAGEVAYIDKDGKIQRKEQIRVVTAAGAVTVSATTDYCIVVNKTTGAATTVNLPAVAAGLTFVIKDGKGDAATNNITLTPAAGTIDGAATKVMNLNYDSMTVICDGTNWWVI